MSEVEQVETGVATMQAAVVAEDRSLQLESVERPEPGPGQVRVRVAACGICGSDLHMLRSPALPAGSIMGHEFAGAIDALGEGVDGANVGDRVVRSEERRVGKECRSWWSPYHLKKK